MAAAASPIWWSQATGNEVYGLNLLFVSLAFLILFRLLKGNGVRRNFVLLAYLLGLSFTNHLQTVLWLPTLLLLLFFHWKSWRLNLAFLLLAGLVFLLGLSLYAYLPIRSATGPLADWGETSNWGNLIRHISGWQYRVYIFDIPADQIGKNAVASLGTIAAQLKWPFWVMFAGLFFVPLLPNRRMGFPFLLYPVIIILYNAGYAIPDIDFYYLPAIFCFFLLAGLGAFGWLGFLSRRKHAGWAEAALLTLLGVSTAFAVLSNWAGADQSKNRFAQETLENIYRSAPAGGLIFTGQWDHYSPWLYNRFVLGKRADLKMLNVNLTNRSWYLDFLDRAFPETVAGLKGQIAAYRRMVRDFETGRPIQVDRIEALHQSILASILRKSLKAGPVYFDVGANFDSSGGRFLAPEGTLFRVYAKQGYYPFPASELGFSRRNLENLPEEKIIRREIETLEWILNLRKSYERSFGPKSDTANKPARP